MFVSSGVSQAGACLNSEKNITLERLSEIRSESESYLNKNMKSYGTELYMEHISCIEDTYETEAMLAYINKKYSKSIEASGNLLGMEPSYAKAFFYFVMAAYESKNEVILERALKLYPKISERNISDKFYKNVAGSVLKISNGN